VETTETKINSNQVKNKKKQKPDRLMSRKMKTKFYFSMFLVLLFVACSTKQKTPEQIAYRFLNAIYENDVPIIKELVSDDFLTRDCPKPQVSTGDTIYIALSGHCLKNLLDISFEKRKKIGEMAKTSVCSIEEYAEGGLVFVSFIENNSIFKLTMTRSTPKENKSENSKVDDFYINF
jgi:hypothetical protein